MASEPKLQPKRRWLIAGTLFFAWVLIATAIAYRINPQEEIIQPTRSLAKADRTQSDFTEADRTNMQTKVRNRPIQKSNRGFVTSDNCRECHAHHYDTWHASHHRTMTQVPTEESVIADFDNKILHHSGKEFRFFHEDGEYFMETKSLRPDSDDETPISKVFKIALMTGAHHQQGFWCETDNGRTLRKIPFIWINKENRWVPYGSIFLMPAAGLSMHAGIWNSNCIKCHVVGGQPRYEPEAKTFDTHVGEFGISCEACHGPAEAHVALHAGNDFFNQTREPLGSPELHNPSRVSHEKSSQVCGQCHAVFDFYDQEGQNDFILNEGIKYRPGEDLLDSRHVFRFGKDEDLPIVKRKVERNPKFWEQQFWSDGMVRVSGREYNGLLETPCYQRGTMSCLSCHDMHPSVSDDRPWKVWADDQMKPGMRENGACLQCHTEYKSEEKLALHTHHAAGSSGSSCYNCHMPHTTLGLMKAIRSHTIDSPNVATTQATGRPNACNLCHLDKSLAWTSDYLEQWYEIPQPTLNEQEKEIASSIRWILRGDAGQRAIVGWHYGWDKARETSGTQWMAPFLAELLTDTYDVVRFNGYHSLKQLPEFADLEYDYVGSEEHKALTRDQVLQTWNDSRTKPTPSTALLVDEDKALLQKMFREIRNQRIDPPMTLIE